MSTREFVSPQSAIIDIADARFGEKLKTIFDRATLRTGLGRRTIKRAYYDERPSERALSQLFARAAERKLELAAALEAADAVDRESIAKVRFLAGQYAIRARAFGAAVVEG